MIAINTRERWAPKLDSAAWWTVVGITSELISLSGPNICRSYRQLDRAEFEAGWMKVLDAPKPKAVLSDRAVDAALNVLGHGTMARTKR